MDGAGWQTCSFVSPVEPPALSDLATWASLELTPVHMRLPAKYGLSTMRWKHPHAEDSSLNGALHERSATNVSRCRGLAASAVTSLDRREMKRWAIKFLSFFGPCKLSVLLRDGLRTETSRLPIRRDFEGLVSARQRITQP